MFYLFVCGVDTSLLGGGERGGGWERKEGREVRREGSEE